MPRADARGPEELVLETTHSGGVAGTCMGSISLQGTTTGAWLAICLNAGGLPMEAHSTFTQMLACLTLTLPLAQHIQGV